MFLLVFTAQALVFLLVFTAQALVFLLALTAQDFLLVSMRCNTDQALVVLAGVSVL